MKDGDNGMFTCLAQNLVGSAESNTEIKVRRHGPRRPKLLIKPFDMEAPERTSIEVPCKADGDPAPNITWTKDGVDLVPDQNHKLVLCVRNSENSYRENTNAVGLTRFQN